MLSKTLGHKVDGSLTSRFVLGCTVAIVACLCLFSCITCSALSVTQNLFYFLVTNFGRLIVQGKGSMQSKKIDCQNTM